MIAAAWSLLRADEDGPADVVALATAGAAMRPKPIVLRTARRDRADIDINRSFRAGHLADGEFHYGFLAALSASVS